MGEPGALELIGAARAVEERRRHAIAGWTTAVHRYARAGVWCVPVAAGLFGVCGWLERPAGAAPGVGRWLAFALAALAVGLVGVIALAGLLVGTGGSRYALASVLGVVAGTVLVAPALGAATLVSGAPPGAVTGLALAGLTTLALGWLAVAGAVIASAVLNASDGLILFVGLAAAAIAPVVGLPFLQVIGAMLLLAAGLGIAWAASRSSP